VKAVGETLGDVVRGQLGSIASEAIEDGVTVITAELRAQVATALSTTDTLLRDNVTKMVKSKPVLDALAGSATKSLADTVKKAYLDAFNELVVPAFDGSCKTMFGQLDEAFKGGVQEHVDQMRKQSQLVDEQMGAFRNRVLGEMESRQATLAKNLVASVEEEVKESLKRLSADLSDQMKGLLRDELSQLSDQQMALAQAIRSAAPTPVPTPHPPSLVEIQGHLLTLVQGQRVNDAFQQALSANDLSLVVWLCSRVNPSQLFAKSPIPLEQPVILSLIQQLASDLSTNTELKLKYLEEAVLAVERSHGATQDHVSLIIPGLIEKIVAFLKKAPTGSPHIRSMKMLQMAAKGLIG
jgi:enhancer of mRNA-decapping protein 4